MKVEGLKITKVLDTQSGTSKAGKEWSKLTFVGETDEEYNNVYAFDIFQAEGKDQLDNFLKFNKVGDLVNVEFNVKCREWEGKYFTSLSSWRVDKAQDTQQSDDVANHDMEEELPF